MQALDDDSIAMDNQPLRAYDSELERVKAAVDEYANEEDGGDEGDLGGGGIQGDYYQATGEGDDRHDDGHPQQREADDEPLYAVPTEVLQEDLETTIPLPTNFQAGVIAAFVAEQPRKILTAVFMLAGITALWVLLTPGDKFSVSEDLFIARGKPDVRHFYELNDVARHYTANHLSGMPWRRLEELTGDERVGSGAGIESRSGVGSAGRADSGGPALTSPHGTEGRRGRRLSAGDDHGRRLSDGHEAITIVYEKRGLGESNMLSLRQLKEMHEFETQLWSWLVRSGACYRGGGGGPLTNGCRPMDSILNYLYPSVLGDGPRSLYFDGRMVLDRAHNASCAIPPFTDNDVAQTLGESGAPAESDTPAEPDLPDELLAARRRLNTTSNTGAFTNVLGSSSSGFTRRGGLGTAPTGGDEDAADADAADDDQRTKAAYLRSTLYVDKRQMGAADWYELASLLYKVSASPMHKSWYVRVYFGGPLELMTAELLVLLMNDLVLLLLSVCGIALYMRAYFGQWRMAGLAALQILLSFPIMYFVVCVLCWQRPLSAFAAASLAVVIGVSADNIFVLHETWGQSRMLRRRTQPASYDERIEWTVRQAGVPLFFANATTAASLFVNCLSPIRSILQFGLCGGVLIFINFSLVLVYLPAVLILEEHGYLDPFSSAPDPNERERQLKQRMVRLQSIHRSLWDRRTHILVGFAAVVALLTPFALSLSPGSDASFTFAPDPVMTRIIERARLAPGQEGALFRSAEGEATTQWGYVMHSSDAADAAADADDTTSPRRYAQLLDGSFTPPVIASGSSWFGSSLALLCLYDSGLLAVLTYVLHSEAPVGFFQPPQHVELPSSFLTGLNLLTSFFFIVGVVVGGLALFLCDFSREMYVPLGECLGSLLLLHSAFFARVALVAHSQKDWFVIRVTEWMHNERGRATSTYAMASAACFMAGVVVLSVVNGNLSLGWSFGWTFWGPAGVCLLLSMVLLYDASVLGLAALASFHGENISYLRSRPEWKVGYYVLSALHSNAGWALFLFSGLPIARQLPSAVADILALYMALNCAAHISCFFVVLRNQANTFFAPTDFSERSRDAACLHQALAAAFFALGALLAWFAANNPTVCDANVDHNLSLQELQECIDAIHVGWLRGLGGLGGVFVGGCLGLLWLIDGAFFAACARVVRTGEALSFVAPASELRGDMRARSRLLRRFRSGAALLILFGGATLVLALSPAAFGLVFGPRAIIASNLLAFSLLLHVPFFTVLSRVFRSSNPYFMLHPTETSRRSLAPAYSSAFAALFCLLVGLAILITQDSIPTAGAWPDGWLASGMDWHGLLLSLMLIIDAALLLRIADVQLTGHARPCIRPLPEVGDYELADLGENLALASGIVQGLVLVSLWITFYPGLAGVLFGTVRVIAIAWELTLGLHAAFLFGLGYLFRRGLALGVFEPPSPRDAPEQSLFSTERIPSTLQTSAAVCLALSLIVPLADGGYMWEALGNILWVMLVVSVPLTHGLYTGGVLAEAFGHDRRVLRRVSFGGSALVAFLMGSAFTHALATSGQIVLEYHTFWPVQYLLIVALAVFALINIVPIAGAMETWYTGITFCGFAKEDAPYGREQHPSALALLVSAIACAMLGGALWTTAASVIDLSVGTLDASHLPEAPLREAETCSLWFGVDGQLADGSPKLFHQLDRRGAPLLGQADFGSVASQLEMLGMCALLLETSSPLHSEQPRSGDGAPACFYHELRQWLDTQGVDFPLPPKDFASRVLEFLKATPSMRAHVGLDEHSHAVTFIRVPDLKAKFPTGGTGAIDLVADPIKLMRYKSEWETWIEGLPAAVHKDAEGTEAASHLPDADHSLLVTGVSQCAKWSVLETENAFFRSVTTALTVTPFVSMGAIAIFSRSLIISYAALYCLIAMVLSLLGVMHIAAIPLGVTSALALSLVIGMSVDYIIHIAHAYKNSIFAERFYKSRATIFARAGSITSAAGTTLVAVSPMLAAQLLPLREFGQIFFLVTLVSLAFSLAFLVVLMAVGPRATRGLRSAAVPQEEEEAPPRITEPISAGDGWAIQLDDQRAVGVDMTGPRRAVDSLGSEVAMHPRRSGLRVDDEGDDELL